MAAMKCPQCASEQRRGIEFCENCGSALQPMPPSPVASEPVASDSDAGIGYSESASQEDFSQTEETAPTRKIKAQIVPRTRFLVFGAIFYIILITYLSIILFFPQSELARFSAVFEAFWAQFLFLILCLAGITLSLYGLFCFAFEEYLKSKWYRPKFGRVSLNESYITKEQLKAVLDEQEMRIGEVLLNSGRITREHLEEALNRQKRGSGRLGEILKKTGYATEEDIYWALGKMQRKMGEIMVDKGFLSRDDVDWLLSQQRNGPRRI